MRNIKVFNPLPQFKEFLLLEELEKDSIVSQRILAQKSGMALGATNTRLKQMEKKGWIEMRSINGQKTGYYLTKKGILEKERLTSEAIRLSVMHYVWIKDMIKKKLLEMQKSGIRRVAFFGTIDELEIAYMSIQGLELKLVGIIKDDQWLNQGEMFGIKFTAIRDITLLNPEGILITSLSGLEEKLKVFKKYIEPLKIKFFFVE